MTDSDDPTDYVHDPEVFREDESKNGARTTKAYLDGLDTDSDEQQFGRRGWLLVGMLFVAFIVSPITILYIPQARPIIASLGLTYQDAYLVLPLVPALALGMIAVWAAVGNRIS